MFKQEYFEKLTDYFKKENIPFLILRNYENYPYQFGGDIDFLVSTEDGSKIRAIIKEIAEEINAKAWDYCGKQDVSRMPFVVLKMQTDGELEALHLDFLFCIKQFGLEYISTQEALESRRPFKNFFILDEEMEFLHILFQGIFNSDAEHKERYLERIKKYLEEQRKIPRDFIYHLFPSFLASIMIQQLERGEVEKLFSGWLSKKVFFFIKNGLFSKRLVRYFFQKLKRLFFFLNFKGQLVVILGPDGVGKSTTAELAYKLLQHFNVSSYHLHLGFRPVVLPTRQKLGFGEPQKRKKYLFRDILRYCYHFIDYWFGYYINIRPRLVRGEIVIAERYFYDYLLHPERKVGKLNEKFIWWTFRLFMPKPTAVVLLTNEPEEILKRRQELTREEIMNVLKKAEKLGRTTARRFKIIKTDKPPGEVALEMVRWVVCGSKEDFKKQLAILNGDTNNIITAIPLDSLAVLDNALIHLSLAKGTRIKPKIIIAVLRTLNFPFLYPLIFRKRIDIAPEDKFGKLLVFLSAHLGLAPSEISFSIYKAPGKFVLPVFNTKTGEALGYAKIYDTDSKDRGENEARALRYLAQFSFQTAEPPKLLASDYFEENLVNIISTKEGLKNFKGVTSAHIAWIKELAEKTGKRMKFEDSRFAKEIEKEIAFIKNKLNGENFRLVEYFYNKAIKNLNSKEFIFSFVNREFDYHELLYHKQSNFVIDWEHARDEFPPIFDVFNVLWGNSNKKGIDYVTGHINGLNRTFFQENKKSVGTISNFLQDWKIVHEDAYALFFLFLINLLHIYLEMNSYRDSEIMIRFFKIIYEDEDNYKNKWLLL